MTKSKSDLNVHVPKHAKVTSPRPAWQRFLWGVGGAILAFAAFGLAIEQNWGGAAVVGLFALGVFANCTKTYQR